jgi:hypothetical protein
MNGLPRALSRLQLAAAKRAAQAGMSAPNDDAKSANRGDFVVESGVGSYTNRVILSHRACEASCSEEARDRMALFHVTLNRPVMARFPGIRKHRQRNKAEYCDYAADRL